MPSLEELLNTGLGGIIQGGGLPTEEALYNRQAQAEREASFGRGLGISSVTRDALAKARLDAALAAQQAQLAALGQAASVTQGNANRTQQESQFSRNLKQQKSIASDQMLMSGIGAGAGALTGLAGATFGPEIRSGLRGLFRLPPLRQDMPGGGTGVNGVPAGTMPASETPTMPQFDLGAGSGGGPDLSQLGDYQLPTTSFGSQDFSVPAYDFGGLDLNLDLSGLFDSTYDSSSYDPNYWANWGYL